MLISVIETIVPAQTLAATCFQMITVWQTNSGYQSLMEFLQQNWMWITLALTSGALLFWPLIKGTDRQSLIPSDATRLMNKENAVVIDVRTNDEWAKGHIAGARHIPMPTLQEKIAELTKLKKRPMIICCASGNRATAAATVLRKAGFENVFVLAGGITSWLDAKLPVTSK